jgi:hypothetical protein
MVDFVILGTPKKYIESFYCFVCPKETLTDMKKKISFRLKFKPPVIFCCTSRLALSNIADPVSGACLNPESGIDFFLIPDFGSRIPNSQFR